jgi:hypothetical protein
MASESSGFAIAREGLTHDMLNKPISALSADFVSIDNAGGASRPQPHRDIFEAQSEPTQDSARQARLL